MSPRKLRCLRTNENLAGSYERLGVQGQFGFDGLAFQQCTSCNEYLIWYKPMDSGWRLIFPLAKGGAPPNVDIPENVLAIYEEARDVSAYSQRSAAALLRLALQVLIDDIETGNGSINDKIGSMVKKGLNPQVQQAMDTLRVVGNNAVHPGAIQVDAEPGLVTSLFGLVNLVVDEMITRPKHIASLYNGLPQTALDAITKRDS